MNHYSTKDLLSYVAGKLDDDQCFDIETHLGECAECAKRTRAHYYIHENIDKLLDNWSAAQHARELLFTRIYQDAPANIKKKLKSGIDDFFSKLGAGLNVMIDATNKISDVAQAFLFEPKLSFSLAPAPIRITGDLADQAEIKTFQAENHMISVCLAPPKIIIVIRHAEHPYPLACIVSNEKEKETIFTDFRPLAGEDSIIAEFDDIPSGTFTLILEKGETNSHDAGISF